MTQPGRSFPIYLLMGLLHRKGWPKKSGLRRRYTVGRDDLYAACVHGVAVAAGLGAGRPELAGRLLGHVFEARSWDTQTAEELLERLHIPALATLSGSAQTQSAQSGEQSPWDTILEDFLLVAGTPSEVLWCRTETVDFLTAVQVWACQALRWGLLEPEAVGTYLERQLGRQDRHEPYWVRRGIALPAYAIGALEDFFAYCEEVVRGYEAIYGALPQMPPQLAELDCIRMRVRPGAAMAA